MGRPQVQTDLAKSLANLSALTWREKVQLAGVAEESIRAGNAVSTATDVLALLMRDARWEVRKAVAERLEWIPDGRFAEFAAVLQDDRTSFVANAAKRAIQQRDKSAREASRRKIESLKVVDGYERFAKRYGPAAATEAKNLGEGWCEESIRVIAHECLNSLASVRISLGQIKKGGSAHEVSDHLASADGSVAFLQRLMRDMRDYFRELTLDSTQERLFDIAVDAQQRALEELRALQTDTSRAQVDIRIARDITIDVSRALFVASLKNLIKNGIEAILDTTRTGKVCVFAETTVGTLEITVKDDGCGIPEETLLELRKFAPGITTKTSRGAGFGLPLVKRYVSHHSGEVGIESLVNEGTAVTIILPREELE